MSVDSRLPDGSMIDAVSHGVGARRLSAVVAMIVVACGAGCGWVDSGPDPVDGFMSRVDDITDLDEMHEEIPFIAAHEWVETYRPERSSAGYNLVFYNRRIPMILDMQGRVVHTWPRVRGVGRARLEPGGRLVVIGIDDFIKEYDWEGNLTWAFALANPDDLPHHDFIRLANGSILVLAQETSTRSDYLQEVDSRGQVVWEWWPRDHLEEHFPDRDRRYPDPTHINSVFELPDNRWFDGGDARFRPGNILVSARNLNTIFVIDEESGEIVWKYSDGLDYQHEAQMVPRGVLGEGLIVCFNNGAKNRNGYRRSEVRVVHPTEGRVVWNYSEETFFTTVAGSQQVLPNGNLLISSSEGGRVFEITPDKQKIWEWIPPNLPMRVTRYPSDFCPQLQRLGPLDPTPVIRTDRKPWVDIELGQFTFRNDYKVKTIYGLVREVLIEPSGCRELLLPADPVIQAAYGFDEAFLRNAPGEATFRITVRDLAGGGIRTVIEETVKSGGDEIFKDRYVAVPGLGLKRVELCVDAWVGVEPDGSELHRSVFLTNPRFYSRPRAQLARAWKDRRISLQEQSLQERQLRAIGYVQ